MPNIKNSILQKVNFSDIIQYDISLYIKREDLIHPDISGNKYRKLKYNILEAKKQKKEVLLTFGGAFSNHIAATAAAGKAHNLKTIGVIRGDELGVDLENTLAKNPTLKFANECGMQFEFVTRSAYREKTSKEFIATLHAKFGNFYLVPEGGANNNAVKGCEEILNDQTKNFDYICTAVGTGGTIAGLINTAENNQKVIGFPALKGNFLASEIEKYAKKVGNWSLNTNYNFGGYAKTSNELINFINKFKKETNIPLDPVYTGKMMFGLMDLIKKQKFKKGTKILAIHTGGLQGIEGMNVVLKQKNAVTLE